MTTDPRVRSWLRVVRAGLLYFVLVFGAGFVLGPIRLLVLVPRIGTRAAELLELPVMVAISWYVARSLTRRLAIPTATLPRLAMGLVGMALIVVCEFTLVLRLRGLTLEQYFAGRDPVSGAAYYLSLVLVALLPLVVNRRPR
jgi:hypothetical protein